MSFKPCFRFSKIGRKASEKVINIGKFEGNKDEREGEEHRRNKVEGMMRKRTKRK